MTKERTRYGHDEGTTEHQRNEQPAIGREAEAGCSKRLGVSHGTATL